MPPTAGSGIQVLAGTGLPCRSNQKKKANENFDSIDDPQELIVVRSPGGRSRIIEISLQPDYAQE
jgi:hypothetical protein